MARPQPPPTSPGLSSSLGPHWQEAVDARFVAALWRRAARPGLVRPEQATAMLTRHLGMTGRLLLAERLVRRADVGAGSEPAASAAPIVYAQRRPLPGPTPQPHEGRGAGRRVGETPSPTAPPTPPVVTARAVPLASPPAPSLPSTGSASSSGSTAPMVIQRKVDPAAATTPPPDLPGLPGPDGVLGRRPRARRGVADDDGSAMPSRPAAGPRARLGRDRSAAASGSGADDGSSGVERPSDAGTDSSPGGLDRPVVVGRRAEAGHPPGPDVPLVRPRALDPGIGEASPPVHPTSAEAADLWPPADLEGTPPRSRAAVRSSAVGPTAPGLPRRSGNSREGVEASADATRPVVRAARPGLAGGSGMASPWPGPARSGTASGGDGAVSAGLGPVGTSAGPGPVGSGAASAGLGSVGHGGGSAWPLPADAGVSPGPVPVVAAAAPGRAGDLLPVARPQALAAGPAGAPQPGPGSFGAPLPLVATITTAPAARAATDGVASAGGQGRAASGRRLSGGVALPGRRTDAAARDTGVAHDRDAAVVEVDVDRIVDRVHRRFLRQLAIERERRGVW